MIISVVILVVLLAGGGAFVLYRHNHKAKPIASVSTTKTSSAAKSSATSTASNAVTIDYVTIPTKVNESQAYPMNGAQTAQGNYVYVDPNSSSLNLNDKLGGTLIYDGKTIYQGSDLVQGVTSYVISQNGLHYAYMKYDNSTTNIYVDNKLVQSVPNQVSSSAVTLYAVSNNGQDYAYGYAVPTSQSSSVFAIFKDGKQLFRNPSSIFTVDFSENLSHYVASVQIPTGSNGNVTDDIIKDGTNEGSGNQAFISPDGSQYISLANNSSGTSGTVSVNGKSVGTVTEVNGGGYSMVINNNGTYAFTNFANHLVNINGTAVSIPTTIPAGCGQGCVNLFAVNQTDTHYITGDYKPVSGSGAVWYMDGNSITLTGNIEGLEFNNNTLYVYKWSN